MANFYRNKTFAFKLKSLEVTERRVIWSSWDNKGDACIEYSLDGKSQVKFPLKDKDALKDHQGQLHQVKDLVMLTNRNLQVFFPKLVISITNFRPILVGGFEYVYEFKKSVNDKITQLLLLNGGNLPTTYLMQSFFPNETAAKMYNLSIVTDAVAKEWESKNLGAEQIAQPGQPPKQPIILADEAPLIDDEVDEFERSFIDQIKAIPKKLDEATFIKSFLATAAKYSKIPEYTNKGIFVTDRAGWLFNNKYK